MVAGTVFLVATAVFASSVWVEAQKERTASEPVGGARIYALNCAPCHGPDGNSDREFGAPALAGQKDWYLIRQLQNFRDGTRGAHPEDLQGRQMTSVIRLLGTDDDIKAVVQHISAMRPFKVPLELGGDASRGKQLFETCAACHGKQGEGNLILNAPRIAGQADWYVVRQLSKFKAGIRGAHVKDIQGMQMAAMAKTLADEQAMKDLAAYLNGLQ